MHQFGDPAVNDGVPFMTRNNETLKTHNNVDLVAAKVRKYNLMTNSARYPFIRFRGTGVFIPNRWERHGHYDKPPMNVEQVFGLKRVPGKYIVGKKPNVFIIA